MRAWRKLRALIFRVLERSQRRYLALIGQCVSLKVSTGKLVRRSTDSHVVLESSLGCQKTALLVSSVLHDASHSALWQFLRLLRARCLADRLKCFIVAPALRAATPCSFFAAQSGKHSVTLTAPKSSQSIRGGG